MMLAQKTISQKNRVNILRFIRDNRETTRIDIAAHLDLSHTTVKAYVDQLLIEGLVEEAGTAASIGGRRPKSLRMIPDARLAFGVNFAPDRVDLLLINLLREELWRESICFAADTVFTAVLNTVAERIERKINDTGLDTTKMLGIGLVFPGVVDDDRGRLLYAAKLGVRDYDFHDFSNRIGLPVFVENEANAAANAERIVGRGNGRISLVYVSIAEGIGTGMIINNQIYKSRGKKSGEFGHVRIAEDTLRCKCGRSGCWELYASKEALLRYYSQMSGRQDTSLDAVFTAYQQGDLFAASALETYTRCLFKGLEVILLALNPDEIVIGGDMAVHAPDIIAMGVEKLHLLEDFPGYEDTRVVASSLIGNGALLGAAILPLEQVYNFKKNVI